MRPITEFTDYRSFLRAWSAERPRQRSQRNLAKRLGLAPSFVSMVFNGKRALSPDDAEAWGLAMQLAGDDLAHWIAMVRAAHGGTTEREEASVSLRARRNFVRAKQAPIDQDAFARVHTWTIFSLAQCDGFRPEASWLVERVVPEISLDAARESVEALVAAGLLQLDVAGVWRAVDDPLAMPPETDRTRVERLKQLHREQLAHGASALEHPPESRHVVSVVVAVPLAALPDLKRRLEKAVLEAVETAKQAGSPDHVVQVSLQVVPRSR